MSDFCAADLREWLRLKHHGIPMAFTHLPPPTHTHTQKQAMTAMVGARLITNIELSPENS